MHMKEVALGAGETIIQSGAKVATLYFPSSAVISDRRIVPAPP